MAKNTEKPKSPQKEAKDNVPAQKQEVAKSQKAPFQPKPNQKPMHAEVEEEEDVSLMNRIKNRNKRIALDDSE